MLTTKQLGMILEQKENSHSLRGENLVWCSAMLLLVCFFYLLTHIRLASLRLNGLHRKIMVNGLHLESLFSFRVLQST